MSLRLIELGWKLRNRSSYEARLRSGLLFIGVTMAAAVVLGGLSLPDAIASKHHRAAALEIVYGEPETSSAVRGLGSAELGSRRWGGNSVERTLVAIAPGGAKGFTIPGVETLPKPGQAVVSPALMDRAKSDPTLRALLSATKTSGVIGRDGLSAPGELRLVIGVPWDMRGLRPIAHVGARVEATNGPVDRVLGSFIFLLVGSTALSLVILCARLGSRGRQKRLSVLRQIGLSESQVRAVMVVDTAIVTLPASLGGVLLYAVFAARDGQVPMTGFDYFSSDLILPVWIILLAILCIQVAVALAAAREVAGSEAQSRGLRSDRRRLSSLAPGLLLIGMIGLFIVPPLSGPKATVIAMWLAIGLVAVGVGGSAAPIIAFASRLAAGRVRRGGWLVGLRINAAEPGTAARVIGFLATLVVCLTAVIGLMNVLVGGSNARHASGSGDAIISVSDYGGALSVDDITGTPGVVQAVPILQLQGDKDTVLVAQAGCEDLSRLIGSTPTGCSQSGQWLAAAGAGGLATESRSIKLPSGGTTRLPSGKDTLLLDAADTDLLDGVLLLPTLTTPIRRGDASRYLVRLKTSDYSVILARLSSLSPYSSATFGSNASGDGDTQEYTEQLGWLQAGTGIALAFAWLGLAIGLSGDAEARRSRIRGLAVLGATRRDFVEAHVAMMVVPTLIVAVVASALAILTNLVMTAVDERAAAGTSYFIALVGGSVLLAGLTGLATLPTTLRPVFENGDRS